MSEPLWHEVRDDRGRLLFKYDPHRNVVELKFHKSDVRHIINLDDIRERYGCLPGQKDIDRIAAGYINRSNGT